ncbi:MinD/ParA family ATP-binding protein [Cryptosporangium phraense]|uniref:Carbon monoxide dehydrogenase maturation protein n=1 Tax=Cryptosporangium phraense TaxID=2593070 RepID=A0A545AN61_9ACTN|nr:carbon monoxide dehydrogenase maturation protein [Cryptosporangium phraense]TQS42762.1 carbon monoxide dehydrogenase maturation protein [Cryptosporangium phraense]
MPLIVWASAKGSPGVTTAVVAVADAWPSPDRLQPGDSTPLVVEADPHGGDLAARYRLPEEPGLAGLAAAVRSPRDPDQTVSVARSFARALGCAQAVTAPAGAGQTRAALSILAAAGGPLAVAGLSAVPLLVDVGRLSRPTPVAPLLVAADLIVLVSRTGLADLAHAQELAGGLAGLNPHRQIVLRGASSYSSLEISAQLDVPVLGRLPDDRRVAASIRPRAGSRWARAIATVARQLAEHVDDAQSTATPTRSVRPAPVEPRWPTHEHHRRGAQPHLGVVGQPSPSDEVEEATRGAASEGSS